MSLADLPVYKDQNIPKVNSDGKKVIAVLFKDSNPMKSKVLVHPDHWDEFCATFSPNGGGTAGSDGEIAVWNDVPVYNTK